MKADRVLGQIRKLPGLDGMTTFAFYRYYSAAIAMARFAPSDQSRSVILRFRTQMMRLLSLIYKQTIFKITLQNRNVEAHNLKNCSSELKFWSSELQSTSPGPQTLQFGTRINEMANCKIRGWDSNPVGGAYPPPRG